MMLKVLQIIEEMEQLLKKVKSHLGELELNVPRDRDSSFEPVLVEKRQKDISDIEQVY